jgi:hypothetical protein
MERKVLLAATIALAGLLTPACSEAPKTESKADAEAKKEPEVVTAQRAFYELYKPARTWATDLLVLSVTSGEVPNFKNEDGKAGVWTVVFVSPSRREARVFTYAIADGEGGIRKGIDVGNVQPWAGATPASRSFSNSEFVVDSDAAYKTAAEQAASWLKTHPDEKVTFRLGSASKYPAPVWYIMWGSTKNGYAALVNALTGAIVK